mgnify:CR=1 FL=1
MNLLNAWVFSTILALAPSNDYTKKFESETEMKSRYQDIANDMVDAIEASKPIFKGDRAELDTAALLISIAKFESGFRKDIDDGIVKGDSGRSVCLAQINIGNSKVRVGDDEMRSWMAKDLIMDRKKCFMVAIETIRESMRACKGYKGSDMLSMYTTGTCQKDEKYARHRWNLAKHLIKTNPFESN